MELFKRRTNYKSQTQTLKKATISGMVTMPLWVLPWTMLKGPGVTTLFTFILFGTSYTWLRYWRSKEGKAVFMKFNAIYPIELESLRIQISSLVDTSRII